MQQGNEGPRRKTRVTSEGADIRQELHEDRRVADRKRLVGSSTGLREVTGHCVGVGFLRNERADV
jgi:hypothetical protein